MIEIEHLKAPEDVGRWVLYNKDGWKPQKGRIKRWSKKLIFVVYHCGNDWDNFLDHLGVGTQPRDLDFKVD